MDTEHRHELKENELYEFFQHFRDWWEKHGLSTMLLVLVALAAFLFYRWYSGKEHRDLNTAWTALADTSSPEGLVRVADEHADREGVRAYALLQAAHLLSQEAMLGQMGMTGEGEPLDPEQRELRLERAAELYQRVIQLSEPRLLVLNARFGLAAVYESMRRFDEAREQYEQTARGAQLYSGLAEIAERKMRELEDLQSPVEFPEAPESSEATVEDAGEAEFPDAVPPALVE